MKHNGSHSEDLKFFYKGYRFSFTSTAVIIEYAHSYRNKNLFLDILGLQNLDLICIRYKGSKSLDDFTKIIEQLSHNEWTGK